MRVTLIRDAFLPKVRLSVWWWLHSLTEWLQDRILLRSLNDTNPYVQYLYSVPPLSSVLEWAPITVSRYFRTRRGAFAQSSWQSHQVVSSLEYFTCYSVLLFPPTAHLVAAPMLGVGLWNRSMSGLKDVK